MFLSIGSIPHWGQWLAGMSLSVGSITAGTSAGWASPYIAQLTAPDCTHRLKLTSAETSWIASLLFLGLLIGTILGALIQDFIGRKKTLLLMGVPLTAGYALIIVAPSVLWLYVSRFITGMAIGMIHSSSASFLGEVADPKIRGSLIMITGNALSFGSLLGTIMGALMPMETFSYICIALTGLFFVMFAFVPESPYYHIAKGDLQKAEETLKWFRNGADVKHEIQELQDFIAASPSYNITERINAFKKTKHLKSLGIVLCVSIFLHFAGQNTTNSYAETILTDAKISLTASVVVMALSFSAIISGTAALMLVDKFGRKPLLIGSGVAVGVGHGLLGLHFHMLSSGTDPESISWLPVFSLFLVYFGVPCGMGTMGDTLLGELFPPILKTPASFSYYGSAALLSFAISSCFQPYMDLVGAKFVFWTFAASALCSVVFAHFCIPETKGISLIDIQGNLKDNNESETAKDVKTPRDVETDNHL